MKNALLILLALAMMACQKEESKKDWENAKIGDVWHCIIDEEDPFVEPLYLYYTIKDIKNGYMKYSVTSIKKGRDTLIYDASDRLSDLKRFTKQ